jgi:hypothetical protein
VVLQLKKGKQTTALQRPDAASAPESLCFSVVSPARTLDLQAVSEAVRDQWLQAIHESLLFINMPPPQVVKGDALVQMHDVRLDNPICFLRHSFWFMHLLLCQSVQESSRGARGVRAGRTETTTRARGATSAIGCDEAEVRSLIFTF